MAPAMIDLVISVLSDVSNVTRAFFQIPYDSLINTVVHYLERNGYFLCKEKATEPYYRTGQGHFSTFHTFSNLNHFYFRHILTDF